MIVVEKNNYTVEEILEDEKCLLFKLTNIKHH